MIKGLYSAVSAMILNATRQQVVSHNIANTQTPGFKQKLTTAQYFMQNQARKPRISNFSGVMWLLMTKYLLLQMALGLCLSPPAVAVAIRAMAKVILLPRLRDSVKPMKMGINTCMSEAPNFNTGQFSALHRKRFPKMQHSPASRLRPIPVWHL